MKYSFFQKHAVVGLTAAFTLAASAAIYAALVYGLSQSDDLAPQMGL